MVQETGVLTFAHRVAGEIVCMPTIEVRFNERDTLPELMERRAQELDITVEQLVKRFICAGMQDYEDNAGPTVPGETLEDFLVKNGLVKDS